jgi:hypothetical protein
MLLWKVDRTSSNYNNKLISKILQQLLVRHKTHVNVGNVFNLDLLRSLFDITTVSVSSGSTFLFLAWTHVVDQDLQMPILLHVLLDDVLAVLILHQITRDTKTLATLTLDLALHVLGTKVEH